MLYLYTVGLIYLRTQLQTQVTLCVSTVDGDYTHAHCAGILDAKVPETCDMLDN